MKKFEQEIERDFPEDKEVKFFNLVKHMWGTPLHTLANIIEQAEEERNLD